MVAPPKRSSGPARRRPLSLAIAGWSVCVGCAAAAGGAFAAGAPDAADPGPEPALSFALEGSVERIDGLRPQLSPAGVSTSLVDVSNRVWLGWGRTAWGVGFGAQTPQIDLPTDPSRAVAVPQPSRPSMSVGWRYSLSDSSSLYAGATAARAWGGDDALATYRARAGVEWKAARSRLGFDGGRLGLQLDSGYRMSIRTRSGGVQVALRRTF